MKRINSLFIVFFIILLMSSVFSEEQVDLVDDSQQQNNVLKIKDVADINKGNVVTILALNKITAKSYSYDIEVGKSVKFERLLIQPIFCWKSLPEEIPENKALLKITETRLDRTEEQIFYGWMFSSSPGLSPLEHSMYDITVIGCK